ncbi:MAG: VanW family protein, partial [Oscillospiraceae bacterium]
MDENQHPVAPKHLSPSGGKKAVLIVLAALVAALAIGYLALCAVAYNSTTYFPRSTFTFTGLKQKEGDGGRLNVSGMTFQEAADAIPKLGATWYGEHELPIRYGDKTCAFSGKGISMDSPLWAAQHLYNFQHGNGFLKSGAVYLHSVFAGNDIGTSNPPLSESGKGELDGILSSLGHGTDNPVSETTWRVTADDLVLEKGAPGLAIDRTMLEQDISVRFWLSDFSDLALVPIVTQPKAVDLAAIAADIFTAPKNATLDPKTYEIIPHVTGISAEAGALKAAFDETPEGATCTVPLTKTQPEMTTEKLTATLFKDLLGEATSNIGGSSNRFSNVKLSAAACDGRIMLPGDVFSYNNTTGSRTAAAGYLPAPAYVGGKSVDELGGGICQTSSTLYYAALKANLKITERHNHMYAVGYVPDGMDATVYFGASDFQFENNTGSPLKLVITTKGRTLTVQIYGNKPDETYVKMENERLSTGSYETVYKPSPAIPLGTTKVEQTPYTGRKVNVYRCIYGKDDKLISRTLEGVNVYKSRNKIILFNPADAALWGVDPTTGAPVVAPIVPSPAVTPGTTPTPGVTPGTTPAPEETPGATPI